MHRGFCQYFMSLDVLINVISTAGRDLLIVLRGLGDFSLRSK